MQFIDHWKTIWWRRWSTWLAGLNGLLAAYVFSQPILVVGLIGFVPSPPIQIAMVIVSAILAFGLPVLVATIKQPKLVEKIQEKEIARSDPDAPAAQQ